MVNTRKSRVPKEEQLKLINECRTSGMTDTGWQSGRPFIPWRSIPRILWAEQIWRACWRGIGEKSIGKKT